MKKSKKKLTQEDRKLWQAVTETVNPINSRKKFANDQDTNDGLVEQGTATPIPVQSKKSKGQKTSRVIRASTSMEKLESSIKKNKKALRPIVPLSKKEKSKVARSHKPIDGVLDLHGQTQMQAHQSLTRFLRHAQGCDWKIVLIITGKGQKTYSSSEKDRRFSGENASGVLREKVPFWLQDTALRDVVLSVETASRSHGGSGALYVKIRKK